MNLMEKKTKKSETLQNAEEAKAPAERSEIELSDDDLDKVAGGGGWLLPLDEPPGETRRVTTQRRYTP